LLSAEGEDPETLVRNMANHFVGAFEKHPDYLNLMFIELVEFKSEHAVELYQQMLPQVAGLLEHVQSAGQEKLRDIPPLIMLRVFIGLFFSYHLMDQILQPVTTMPATLREKAIDMFIDIFLHGVLREGK
jgi:AcrR family transcriptional regulator